MSMLVVTLPPRPRDAEAATAAPPELAYVLGDDGGTAVARQGRAAAALLPKAATVVAVVPATELAWHRVPLPKAPAHRLREALAGVLEERLLDEDAAVHLALAPAARAGEPTWIAAVHRPWLAAELAALEATGQIVDRVVPAVWPDAAPQGHFFAAAPRPGHDEAMPWLALADADGAASLPLAGSLARALQPGWTARGTRWSAEPAVAAAAEQWLGAAVTVQDGAERALAAARSPWNLRQFDLAPRHRGLRAATDLLRRLRGPAWRPVRWGLAALLVLQLVGLNLYAWQLQRGLQQRRGEAVTLLQSAHPQVRAVLDAPLQMQRETEALRTAAGRPGDGDLEPLLAAAAQAWPEGQPPATTLRFEPGRLQIAAAGWPAAQVEQFRARLRPAGWSLEQNGDQLSLRRGNAPAAAAPATTPATPTGAAR